MCAALGQRSKGVKIKVTRVEDVRSAESNRSEDDVAAEEEEVGDAEGSQQVVEHIVHLPGFQILDVYHRVVKNCVTSYLSDIRYLRVFVFQNKKMRANIL